MAVTRPVGPARIARIPTALDRGRELVLDPRVDQVDARQELGAVGAARVDRDERVRAREEIGAAGVPVLDDSAGGVVVEVPVAGGAVDRDGRAQVHGRAGGLAVEDAADADHLRAVRERRGRERGIRAQRDRRVEEDQADVVLAGARRVRGLIVVVDRGAHASRPVAGAEGRARGPAVELGRAAARGEHGAGAHQGPGAPGLGLATAGHVEEDGLRVRVGGGAALDTLGAGGDGVLIRRHGDGARGGRGRKGHQRGEGKSSRLHGVLSPEGGRLRVSRGRGG